MSQSIRPYSSPFQGKLILCIFVALLLFVVCLVIDGYRRDVGNFKKATCKQLKAVAFAAAMEIDGDLHQMLSEKYMRTNGHSRENDSLYKVLNDRLKKHRDFNQLNNPIQTFTQTTTTGDFKLTIGSSPKQSYSSPSTESSFVDVKETFLKSGILDVRDTLIDRSLSVVAPIRNAQNKVVAVVQVKQNLAPFLNQARLKLITKLLLAIVTILPLAFLLYVLGKRGLTTKNITKEQLVIQNEKIRTQNETIVNSNKRLKSSIVSIQKQNKVLDNLVQEHAHELSKANDDLHSFLYRSYHDIQGPVATLRGITQLALMEIDAPLAKHYISLVESTTDDLSNRIKDIHALYEIKNKSLEISSFNLKDLYIGIRNAYMQHLQNKDIHLDLKVGGHIRIHTDKHLLTIITKSLISNALLHHRQKRPSFGTISIEAMVTKEGTLIINFEDDGRELNKYLKNTIGTLFKNGNKDTYGLSLGLYVAKLGIDKIGAQIHLLDTSTSGNGIQLLFPENTTC